MFARLRDHPNGFCDDYIDPYFQNLYQRIRDEQNGRISFREPVSEWFGGCSGALYRGTYCPEIWAQDSNSIVCDYAYGRYVNGSDLYKDGYAAGAFHIVENQLAKAAWRTAGWLNTIASAYLPSASFGYDDVNNPIDQASVKHAEQEAMLYVGEPEVVVKGDL